MRQSIRQFGFTNPILVDARRYAHRRAWPAAGGQGLGLAEVPTIELACSREAQKKALRIADNKIALNAGWDLDILKLELDELGTLDVDFDLSLTGFSHAARST